MRWMSSMVAATPCAANSSVVSRWNPAARASGIRFAESDPRIPICTDDRGIDQPLFGGDAKDRAVVHGPLGLAGGQ